MISAGATFRAKSENIPFSPVDGTDCAGVSAYSDISETVLGMASSAAVAATT